MLLHRSPALTAIYNEIKNSNRNQVLELGPMNKGCFRLFSSLSCKIQVEDLHSSIKCHIESNQPMIDFKVEENLLKYDRVDKFDVILAWDLLNYLSLYEIKSLFSFLQPFCKSNTLLYMLRYVEKNIPRIPREILVKDKYVLEMSDGEHCERPSPSFSTLELLSVLPGYFLQDTLIEKSGMVSGIAEHVFRFSSDSESKHLVSKSELTHTMVCVDEKDDVEKKKHMSPSIMEVIGLLQSGGKLSVLDLASSANRPGDLIVECAETYYSVDLFSLIERSKRKNLDHLNLSVLEHRFSCKFDIILTWDIFDYCTADQIKQLNEALSSLCHDNTFLLSYMSTNRKIAVKPNKFEVISASEVMITRDKRIVTRNNTVTGSTLLHLLDNYSMNKTYAYRDGMDREIIEYVFVANRMCVPDRLALPGS